MPPAHRRLIMVYRLTPAAALHLWVNIAVES